MEHLAPYVVCFALLLLNSGLLPTQAVTLAAVRSDDEIVGVSTAARQENNCGAGKLLPSVYLLGAKNCGTTSLYYSLRSSLKRTTGLWAAPRDTKKEWQFFQTVSRRERPVLKPYEAWIDALPACPTQYPAVLGDFSVTNLYCTPFPQDLRWEVGYSYLEKNNTDPALWDSPQLISSFHARAGGRPPKLILMLRDPLHRAESEYYQNLPYQNSPGCMINRTFRDSFDSNVRFMQSTPMRVSDWFWKNFYGRHLQEYLKHFDAAQFVFIPFTQYTSASGSNFSAALLSHLGLDGEPWAGAQHQNSHLSRPPLDQVLPPSAPSRLAFEARMAPETDLLARLLARAQLGGAWLAGYGGPEGDEAQVRAWLVGSW